MLNRNENLPLYIQIKEELTKKIIEGSLEMDSQIPTEKQLMEEYKVGRATVREALSRMVAEGYLYKKQGIGTFVARKNISIEMEPLMCTMTAPWLENQLGKNEMDILRCLKKHFDPNNIMNPGGTIGLDLPEEKRRKIKN